MTDRIVLCATAAQAAEFCQAEKLLAESKRKSVFNRLGPMPKEGSHHALEGSYDQHKRQSSKGPQSRKREQAPPSKFVFFRGHALIGDSILMRMAKAGGSYVSRMNNFCYGGATSERLADSLSKCQEFPSKGIVLVGTNDLLQGVSKFKLVANIRTIINLLQSKGTDVMILTIPAFQMDRPEHSALGYVNSKIKDLDCTVADIYKLFKRRGDHMKDLYERRYFNGKKDLIHPNIYGLKLMMNEVLRCHFSFRNRARQENNRSTEVPVASLIDFGE